MKTAMLLAAGRGERLRPLTDHCPKAMCKVKGIPLIEHHVKNLAEAGFEKIIINHAWLGDKIRQHLRFGQVWGVEIHYSAEPPGGLETGGGIFQALPLIGQEPFLTVNADIYTDFNFKNLTLPLQVQAHLILVKNPPHHPNGDFLLNGTGSALYTFSGIACYRPQALRHLKPGRYSITPTLRALLQSGQAGTELFKGKWIDTGNSANLASAQNL